MNISILALDGVFDFGLAALLDTLGTANVLAGEPVSELEVVGVRRRVRTHRGLLVPTTRAQPDRRPDFVLVPGLGAMSPGPLVASLERPEVTDAGAMLAAWARAGTTIGAACTGTFVLAEHGLLDGERAATSWWVAPLFRERYPRVRLDEGHMLVSSGRTVTAGAALAHLDLALWLIRQASPTLSATTARWLVIDPRPSQATYAIPDHLQHTDPIVERFEAWAREHLVSRFSIEAAARGVGTSPRTLERRLQAVLGRSPGAYVQDLRVERAVHLLTTTDESVDAIAARVGYRDAVTLRTLLRRKLGRGVREIRARR